MNEVIRLEICLVSVPNLYQSQPFLCPFFFMIWLAFFHLLSATISHMFKKADSFRWREVFYLGMDRISVHASVLCVGGLLASITHGNKVSRTTAKAQVYHITTCLLEHVMAEKGSSGSVVYVPVKKGFSIHRLKEKVFSSMRVILKAREPGKTIFFHVLDSFWGLRAFSVCSLSHSDKWKETVQNAQHRQQVWTLWAQVCLGKTS